MDTRPDSSQVLSLLILGFGLGVMFGEWARKQKADKDGLASSLAQVKIDLNRLRLQLLPQKPEEAKAK